MCAHDLLRRCEVRVMRAVKREKHIFDNAERFDESKPLEHKARVADPKVAALRRGLRAEVDAVERDCAGVRNAFAREQSEQGALSRPSDAANRKPLASAELDGLDAQHETARTRESERGGGEERWRSRRQGCA